MTAKPRSQLLSEADTNLPDNTTRRIKPEHVRGSIKDLADSAVMVSELASYVVLASATQAALAAIGNAVNIGGKTLAAWRYDENGRLYRPLGTTAGSAWRPLDDQSGESDITPV